MRQSRGGSGVGNETLAAHPISMPLCPCRCLRPPISVPMPHRYRSPRVTHPGIVLTLLATEPSRSERARARSMCRATIQYAHNTGIIGVGLVGSSCSRSNRSHQSPPLNSQARITPPPPPPPFDTLIAEISSCSPVLFLSLSLSLSRKKGFWNEDLNEDRRTDDGRRRRMEE